MLNDRNVRRRVRKRGYVCAREAREKRQADLRVQQSGARAAGAKDGGWNLSREAESAC
jgi:hypothetical protein